MRRAGLVGIAVLGVAAVVVAIAAARWTPTIPADAASTVVATTILSGPISPDPSDDADSDMTLSPVASECLLSIDRAAGPLSLCYQTDRVADGDPLNDYYQLRLDGTFGGGEGTGVRWAVIRARLLAAPVDEVFDGEPTGDFEGVCPRMDPIPEAEQPSNVGCGNTSAGPGPEPWSHQVAWTCAGCLIPDHWHRGIWLTQMVKVKGGTLPTWAIYADLGS